MSKLEEMPSALKREHLALQKRKFINFCLCLWVVFAGSRDPIKSGSNPDPDPQHWIVLRCTR
jgi:hypothetical protein